MKERFDRGIRETSQRLRHSFLFTMFLVSRPHLPSIIKWKALESCGELKLRPLRLAPVASSACEYSKAHSSSDALHENPSYAATHCEASFEEQCVNHHRKSQKQSAVEALLGCHRVCLFHDLLEFKDQDCKLLVQALFKPILNGHLAWSIYFNFLLLINK